MTPTMRWVLAMTFIGLTTGLVVYALSGSCWWALAGVLASGVVANSRASSRAAQQGGRKR